MDLPDLLHPRSATPSCIWRPRLFNASRPSDRAALRALLIETPALEVCDTISVQIEELIRARSPARDWDRASLERAIDADVGGLAPLEYGRWAFYPWLRQVVHLLPPDEFRFLRSCRNCYKITPDEHERLRQRTIGIVGLSVGLAVATTLALEGVGGRYRLADLDSLGLSNLNRLRAGVGDLGINKAVLAARQLLELDPYLDVEIYPDGVSEENLARFFEQSGPLDLLVEECDDLYAKVALREEARRRGVPVVMDTSDRGMIDVERFDLEPDRPLFHGLAGDIRADRLRGLPTKEKIPFVLRILDAARMSPAALASMVEIKETIETWPQLASSVALGGAVTADVVRRILLGQLERSGRYYIDLEAIIADGEATPPFRAAPAGGPEATAPEGPTDIQEATESIRPIRGLSPAPTIDEVQFIVRHGLLAPSAGNAQPWRFEWRAGALLGFVVASRSRTLLDFQQSASCVALGTAAENMDLAARQLGFQAAFAAFPHPAEPALALRLTLQRDGTVPAESALFEQVPLRVTNRRSGPRVPVPLEDRRELEAAVRHHGARLSLLTDDDALRVIADIVSRCDRLMFLTRRLHQEFMNEMRWTPEEVAATRDGLDVATLELSEADRSAFRIVANWAPMEYLRKIGGGRALERPAREAIRGASAVGLVRVSDAGPRGYFCGGRAVQRLWLTATRLGWAVQPMTTLPYLLARLERGRGEGLEEFTREGLLELQGPYRRLFGSDGPAEVMLLRLARAEPPTARSLRRRLEDVFGIKD
jgi:nitroreductase/molybdopterin/thiamine biosynthesis adenylyltransferase